MNYKERIIDHIGVIFNDYKTSIINYILTNLKKETGPFKVIEIRTCIKDTRTKEVTWNRKFTINLNNNAGE